MILISQQVAISRQLWVGVGVGGAFCHRGNKPCFNMLGMTQQSFIRFFFIFFYGDQLMEIITQGIL